MAQSLLATRLSAAGLVAFLALIAGGPGLANEDGPPTIALSENLAALSGQRARGASSPTRQLGLVGGRLENTRGIRTEGRNLNASSLAMRFSGGSADKSAAFETKNLLAPEKNRRTRRIGVWFGGDVTLDSARAEDPRRAAIYTNGLAFGADMRLGPRLLVGNAVGAAFDKAGFGTGGSMEIRYFSDTLYGSLTTSRDTYLDVALGASRSEFMSHYVGFETLPASHRSASQFFGQVRYSHKFSRGRLRIRSYGKAGFLRMNLDNYMEQGRGSRFCQSQSLDAFELMLGVHAETSAKTRVGKLTPHAVVELSRYVNRTSSAAIISADDIGGHVVAPSSSRSGRVSARSGLDWAINNRATLNGEYSVSSAMADFSPQQRVTARFRLTF